MARFYFVPVEQVGIARGPGLFDPHRLPELQGVVNYTLVLAHTTPEQYEFLNAQARLDALMQR